MRKNIFFVICAVVLAVSLAGCAGYKTKQELPFDIKTIYVPTVKNRLPIETMYIYVPGMEVDITNAVISRFNQDGTLKVVSRKEDADATLEIVLMRFDQQGARFTNLESIEEYELFITTNVQLKDNRTDKILIEETSFTGKSSYFVKLSKMEAQNQGNRREPIGEYLRAATVRATDNYAHNVVDLVTEAW